MQAHETTWVVILAAGDGLRLRKLTEQRTGVSLPKQYWSFHGDASLLAHTLCRAGRLAPPERIVTVVAEQHRHWWRNELAAYPQANVVVQPLNRGTAVGLLLPLLVVAERDPRAQIVVLPSDHFVKEESTLEWALKTAISEIPERQGGPILLGVTPDHPDPDLGWIVEEAGLPSRSRRVARFVEKPSVAEANRLFATGALWNTFIVVAALRRLLGLLEEKAPNMARPMIAASRRHKLEEIYARLPTCDFSREVLEAEESGLWVCRADPCGWSDLGTPERVDRVRQRYLAA